MSLDTVKQQRGSLKAKMTRFRTFVENTENHCKFNEIRERLAKFEPIDDQFSTIQDSIEEAIPVADATAMSAEEAEREAFENEYFRLIAFAKDLIGSNIRCNNAITASNTPTIIAGPSTSFPSIVKQLPRIAIPKFNGDLACWIKFRDSFNSMIHTQDSLSNIDKFNYLSDALEGEAARAIQSLGISDRNYDHAWKKLQDRYEDSEELIHFHTKGLCEITPMRKGSYVDLRRIIDDANNHLIALETLGEPTKQCDSLLIYLIGIKLDDETKKLWDKRAFSTDGKRTFSNLLTLLESHCKYLQKTTTITKPASNNKLTNGPRDRVAVHTTTRTNCPHCNETHLIYSCCSFKALSIPERIERVKELKLCYNCLGTGHRNMTCSSGPCRKCNRRHNTLLHLEQSTSGQSAAVDKAQGKKSVSLSAQVPILSSSHVLLGTAVVEIQDREGKTHECRALLDSGSQVHFITQELCDRLKLCKTKSETTVTGIHQASIDLRFRTLLKFKSRTSAFQATVTCLITRQITDDMPNMTINKSHIQIPTGIELADPQFYTRRPVDLLIGAGLFWDLLCVGQIKRSQEQPLWQKTKLGWIITGNLPCEPRQANKVACHTATDRQLQDQLEKFWTLEECSRNSGAPPLDDMDPCEQYFRASTEVNEAGRFVVALPFNEKKDQLGDSYNLAYKRLLSMEKKFAKCSELKSAYAAFMKEYEELEHMTKVKDSHLREEVPAYYLPHHAVLKEQSTTTKLRVVFDGSSKTTTGISLNDTQHPGYEVQDELICILLRFRKHKYIIAADATKMYRQIMVKEDDRRFQRILWRAEPSQPVTRYQLNTVTYGTRSGAFLAKRCLRQIGEDSKNIFPESSNAICNDFYVDDLLTGANSIEAAKQLKRELSEILATRGFELRKWASNEPQVLEEGAGEDKPIQTDREPKTLGLKWITTSDQLAITVHQPSSNRTSKRTILSQISQIFDPLGLVAPVTIRAKIILQQLWQLKLEWDESLPQDLHTTWQNFQHLLTDLNKLEIPRQAVGNGNTRVELHGFSDASESAFGACIYLRSTVKNNHKTHMLCAKSRVAPIKKVSLPRLELCAALLLAQLANKAARALNISTKDQYFWSDSMIAIAWIRGQSSRWKTFVANRTAEIQRLTNTNWSHVISAENPADLISRGIDPKQLIDSHLWWHGPAWLSRDKTKWPSPELKQQQELPETKNPSVALAVAKQDFEILRRYSSWTRLIRITAYCRKFARLTRREQKDSIDKGRLTTTELKEAQTCLIKLAQQQEFSQELKDLRKVGQVKPGSKLKCLTPFIDAEGIIRVGGRIHKAPIEYEHKHPIILPANHHLSWLIVDYEHKRLLHAGCQAVICSLRTRYWPLSAKAMVKKVVKKCVTCVRFQGIASKHIMGILPSARVTPTRPFLVSGVDYAGPLFLKEKLRSRVVTKAYICIFVCFSTKAVHIELAQDLSTGAFLNCLRRFISRRGRCQKLYSDNGLNFVGARNELNELGCLLRDKSFQDDVAKYANNEQISWHLNPPYAPHFGGLWESAVKTTKFHLKRVVGETRLTYEEMYTILTQIEACLNSRPLYPLSNDPNDLTPLTPSHFLIGEPLMALPEADVREIPTNRLGRYQHLQYMVQHFWQRWQQEYLHGLQQRGKWPKNISTILGPGTLVILKEDNLPPTRWRLGRIIRNHPGPDNVVRVASIRTADGIVTRPVVKIVPLPIDIEDEDVQPTA